MSDLLGVHWRCGLTVGKLEKQITDLQAENAELKIKLHSQIVCHELDVQKKEKLERVAKAAKEFVEHNSVAHPQFTQRLSEALAELEEDGANGDKLEKGTV